ncbi:MAG: undecaprenyl-diphosphate phosphatase [Candidatus Zixiibacteriota bacterium]|nr:MAG: undecaprenyl-diphosphate phosphatase [candidate division Zixibacteria bacterium]
MTYFDAVLLGILQGLTEFLPVSSSGHLVLAQAILGVKQPGVSFEVLAHLGTLLAVFIYFRSQVTLLVRSVFEGNMKEERAIIGYLIIGTIPAGLAGLLFKDFFEQAFSNPVMTSLMLFVTGLILLSTRFYRRGSKGIGVLSTIIMGIGQAAAILPGISRSGTTIAAGMACGVEPSRAAEFSFLLAIPAILGGMVLKRNELLNIDSSLIGPYLVGMVFSFLLALVAVHLVLVVVKRGKLDYFAYYCFAAAGVGLYLFL